MYYCSRSNLQYRQSLIDKAGNDNEELWTTIEIISNINKVDTCSIELLKQQ